MNSLWHWLLSDAGAGWIIGIIGLLGALYSWLKKERPPHILVQEVDKTSLLDVHASQREKIKVFFEKSDETRRIFGLEQRKLVIYNSGSRDVTDEINFTLHAKVSEDENGEKNFPNLLEVIFLPNLPVTILQKADEILITITIPHLNSYSNHRQYVTGYILSDTPVLIDAQGQGKGWSVYFVNDKVQRNLTIEKIFNVVSSISFLAIPLGFVLLIYGAIRDPLGIVYFNPTNENINAAVEAYRQNLLYRQTLHPLIRWIDFVDEDRSYISYWLLIFAAAIFIALLPAIRWLVQRFYNSLSLGIRSNSEFEDE